MIEVVAEGPLEIFAPKMERLSCLHFGGRTCHKIECIGCGHQFHRERMTKTTDGWVCANCQDDA